MKSKQCAKVLCVAELLLALSPKPSLFTCQKTSIKIVNFSTEIEKVSVVIFSTYNVFFSFVYVYPSTLSLSARSFMVYASLVVGDYIFFIRFFSFSLQL